MNSNAASSQLAHPAEPHEALLGTLPLLILVAFLLVAASFTFLLNRNLGPAIFPLWSLFAVLGVIAGLGACVSWFYSDDHPDRAEVATARVGATVPTGAPASRRDFGRPAPEVVRAPPAAPNASADEPWNEDLVPVSAAAAARPTPASEAPSPEPPSDVSRALDEIDDIQRQLIARRPPTAPTESDGAARR
jgi:hypothetical protein